MFSSFHNLKLLTLITICGLVPLHSFGVEPPPLPKAQCKKLFDGLRSTKSKVKSELTELSANITRLTKEDANTPELPYLNELLMRAEKPSPEIIEELRIANRGLDTKTKLQKIIATSLNVSKNTVGLGVGQWKYIGLTMALQIMAEAYSRSDAPDPASLWKSLRELFSNRDFIQDFAFMTNETFWMSALSSTPSKVMKWAETLRSFRLCAVMAFIDSNVMNFAIKGEADWKRVGLDTAWEMVIGSAQTQLDLNSLKAFELLALKVGSSRLKLLGYVVAAADQGIGYYSYSKTTDWYEKQKKAKSAPEIKPEDIKLLPIFSPI
jgi:hypothetical protein